MLPSFASGNVNNSLLLYSKTSFNIFCNKKQLPRAVGVSVVSVRRLQTKSKIIARG